MKKRTLSIFAISGVLAIGGGLVSASATAVEDEFVVQSLSLENFVHIDADDCTGDDGGLVAVNGTLIYLGGDDYVCSYDLPDLLLESEVETPIPTEEGGAMFSDLSSEQAYALRINEYSGVERWDYEIVGFVSILPDGGEGEYTALNQPINFNEGFYNAEFDGDFDCVAIGSGYGRLVVWDACEGTVSDIAIATGDVSVLEGQAVWSDYLTGIPSLNDYSEANIGIISGIAEYSEGTLRLLLPGVADLTEFESANNANGIYRYVMSDTSIAPELVTGFGEAETLDIYSIIAIPSQNLWCGHSENGFDSEETLFCFDALYDEAAAAPTPEAAPPALANTGTHEVGGALVAVLVLLGLGLAAGSVSRTRTNA